MNVASAKCKYLIYNLISLFSTMMTFILIYCPHSTQIASAYVLNAFKI